MTEKEPDKTAAQAEMLFNRLVKRAKHLKKWARRAGVEAFRLYDRDIPEIPLVLDWYGAAAPGSTATRPNGRTADNFPPVNGQKIYGGALAGALYKRPYDKDPAEEDRWLTTMKDAAAAALRIPPESVFLRERRRQRGDIRYGAAVDNFLPADENVRKDIREYGLRYMVNLSGYLDTGLFLDRRLLRALVREEAAGRRVLNLFCYTASLSLAAAAGGAATVDSVDLSNTYLDWARENFALNGLENGPFTFIRADVLRFVDEAACRRVRWDIIILDPPAFSNSKKMWNDFDFKRDHPALIEKCLRLLAPGGTLYLSASVRGFKLEIKTPDAAVTGITERLRDEDFKDKRIPAAWRFHRPG